MKDLTLNELRSKNIIRQAEWPGSEKADLCFRGLEMAGEAGELANKLKKIVRLQVKIKGTTEGMDSLLQEAMDEAADVVICVDLIAAHLGLSLDEAVKRKFNATSEKHDLKTRL